MGGRLQHGLHLPKATAMMRALPWLLCFCPLGCSGTDADDAGVRVPMPVVDPAGALTSCHRDPRKVDADLAARARKLANGIEEACLAIGASCSQVTAASTGVARGEGPLHALAVGPCSSPLLARARYQARLVSEDPAAAVHNAPLARRLLDAAEHGLMERHGRSVR